MAATRSDGDIADLTVLALLLTGPRHTYEMHRLMVDTHKDFVTGLPRSLYHAVERLERAGLIEPVRTIREGTKPERTIYAITDDGRVDVRDRVRRMLEQPTPKSTVFVAALSFMTCLTPDQAAAALRQRLDSLSSSIEQADAEQARIAAELPRVLLVESEFQRHLLDAERSWTRQLLADLETGRLSWPEDVSRIAQLPTGQETDSDHV